MLAVAVGVRLAVMVGLLRFMFGWRMKWLVMLVLPLCLGLTAYVASQEALARVIGLAWDWRDHYRPGHRAAGAGGGHRRRRLGRPGGQPALRLRHRHAGLAVSGDLRAGGEHLPLWPGPVEPAGICCSGTQLVSKIALGRVGQRLLDRSARRSCCSCWCSVLYSAKAFPRRDIFAYERGDSRGRDGSLQPRPDGGLVELGNQAGRCALGVSPHKTTGAAPLYPRLLGLTMTLVFAFCIGYGAGGPSRH